MTRLRPLATVTLEHDIRLVETDDPKLDKVLENIARRASKRNLQNSQDVADRELAREMLSFAETELAVPYQVWLLRSSQSTWQKRDVINSLVRSETLEAANVLVQTFGARGVFTEDVKYEIIDGVYRLRESGNFDIIAATNEFVAKHERPPVLPVPMD
jgi:hypothetical protein